MANIINLVFSNQPMKTVGNNSRVTAEGKMHTFESHLLAKPELFTITDANLSFFMFSSVLFFSAVQKSIKVCGLIFPVVCQYKKMPFPQRLLFPV